MRKLLYTVVCSILAIVALHHQARAQGSTTAAITGQVTELSGAHVVGATVQTTHLPTGSVFGGYTNADGRYTLPNLKVGGPYTLEVSYLGYQTFKKESIYITLGQTFAINVTLTEEGVTVDEVVVVANEDDIFDGKNTGAETNITARQLATGPSVNRSLTDFVRLTPQVSVDNNGAVSVAGSSSKYNNISIDGAVNNDVFGLAPSGTPGGQTSSFVTQTAQPISLDAIEQIQVVIAPYDVRLGSFTGGGINVVTRSGTNKFEGSVYSFFRDKRLTGQLEIPRADGTTDKFEQANSFEYSQYGFRLGGPIIKNKLFFFLSTELTSSFEPLPLNLDSPARQNFVGEEGDSILQSVAQFFSDEFGFNDLGGYGPYTNKFTNQKVLLKLDWNINERHRLSLRHNIVNSRKIEGGGRSVANFSFNNNGQDFTSVTNSTVAELTSTFGTTYANKLRIVHQTVDDDRDPNGSPFPTVRIDNIDNSGDVFLGNERFSTVNKLFQRNISITNDFNIYLGNHTLTLGANNEYFEFRNNFIRDAFGNYRIQDWGDFQIDKEIPASDYSFSYVNPELNLPADWGPKFNAIQLGLYAQDEWAINKKLNLSVGLRMDIPYVLAEPATNTAFNEDSIFARYDVQTQRTPKARVMLAPRIGFNYDVLGDRTLQIRGGVGLFTGRVPFVWISNQFGNTGVEIIRADNLSGGTVPFTYDPTSPTLGAYTIPQLNARNGTSLVPSTSEINVTDRNFRYPQVFRANIGGDYKLPFGGLVATVDLIVSKTLNDIHYQDLNLGQATDTLQHVFGNPTGDNRPLFPGSGTARTSLTNDYTNVILLTNTNKGHTLNATFQLTKPFKNGFTASAAYTFGTAKSINDGTSFQAISNWRFTPNATGLNNLNSVPSTTSNYQVRHRIIGSVSYNIEYLKNFGTTISLFYRGQSGQPYSFIYGFDVNREDRANTTSNDLIYIPRNQSEIRLVTNNLGQTGPEQWVLLNAFIESNKYLREHRGQIAERNKITTPWNHQIDLSIRQDFFLNINQKRHNLQLTLDVFNVANLLNKEWGRQYQVGNQTYRLLDFTSFFPGTTTPQFTFEAPQNNEAYFTDINASIWQMQLGARYSF